MLPDVLNYTPTSAKRALENPLPWDTIPSVDFNKLNSVQPYLADLRRDSESRIATNQDFNFIRQDIDEFKKVQADKTATLNEQEALNERKKNAAEKMTRDKDTGRTRAIRRKDF